METDCHTNGNAQHRTRTEHIFPDEILWLLRAYILVIQHAMAVWCLQSLIFVIHLVCCDPSDFQILHPGDRVRRSSLNFANILSHPFYPFPDVCSPTSSPCGQYSSRIRRTQSLDPHSCGQKATGEEMPQCVFVAATRQSFPPLDTALSSRLWLVY